MNKQELVWEVVRKVPQGKVTTYGEIGRLSGIHPRVVGLILHQNKDPNMVPCHRVVNRKGRVACNYAFGGSRAQKERLEKEGVRFVDENRVDLDVFNWFSKNTLKRKGREV